MDDRPPPSTGDFAIKHEIFLLDANLTSALDQSQMEPITRGLVRDLMAALGLEELGKLELYPALDLRAPGWSFVQPITTSHITGHYFEKPGNHPHIHLDIYSCDSIEWKGIVAIVDKHLALADWRGSFVTRGWVDDEERAYLDLSGEGSHLMAEMPLAPKATAMQFMTV
jgi:S-adenosylmethionine/arginine decarboxylase-like enzyme